MLVLLPILVGRGTEGEARTAGDALSAIGVALLKIIALVMLLLFVGQRAIPKLLNWVVKFGSRELFTLTVLVIALGLAVGAAKLFGASMALGGFSLAMTEHLLRQLGATADQLDRARERVRSDLYS